MNCTKVLTTQAQYDTSFTSSFGPLIHHTLINSLHFNSLSVIDTSRVTKIPTIPRRGKPVAELSLIGKENLCRAQLEAECRFYGNDSEVVSGAPVVKIIHDIITSKINIRTIRSQHM